MRTIKIKIDKKGDVKIEVDGCTGPTCKDITRAIEQALGISENVELKGEFHATEGQGQSVNLGQN